MNYISPSRAEDIGRVLVLSLFSCHSNNSNHYHKLSHMSTPSKGHICPGGWASRIIRFVFAAMHHETKVEKHSLHHFSG